MLNSAKVCLGIAILSLVVGFAAHGYPIIDGLAKALFGVFVIAFLIVRLFGEKNA